MRSPATHHELSPSNFPAWALCPAFDSDPAEREDAAEGTAQHAALAASLTAAAESGPADLSQEARDAVAWAAAYIRALAGNEPILVEHGVSFTAPDSFAPSGSSEVFSGTADAVIIHQPGNLADLVDFKSGADDYYDHRPQLSGYALALFSTRARLKTVRCHVLYGRVRRVDSWSLSQADAAAVVLPIVDSRRNPNRVPAPCDYCGMCLHRLTCPALIERVEMVASADASWSDLAVALRHPNAITDPALASKALTLARIVSTWADAARARATDLAKAGAVLPGYRLQSRRAPREVNNLAAALDRSGLSPTQFLAACKLSLPKLVEAHAAHFGVSKAQANRDVETALADLIHESQPTLCLVPDNKNRE